MKERGFLFFFPFHHVINFQYDKILLALKLKANDTEAKIGFLPFRTLRLSVEAACFSVCSACSRRLVSNSSASCNFLFAFFSFFSLFWIIAVKRNLTLVTAVWIWNFAAQWLIKGPEKHYNCNVHINWLIAQ